MPSYFEGTPDLEQEFLSKKLLQIDGETRLLSDPDTNSFNSLAENFILLANGIPASSFLSLFAVKKAYTVKDFLNQDPFTRTDQQSISMQLFTTLNCFVALAQQDFDKFAANGTGLAAALGETGTVENPAVEKLNSVFLLARGGELPEEDVIEEVELNKNAYVGVFRSMFGIRWRPIIALHKALTLSKAELLQVLGFSLNADQELSPALQNVQTWLQLALLDGALQLNDQSASYCKSIVALIQGHAAGFDFIASERGISNVRAGQIKSLVVSRGHHELV